MPTETITGRGLEITAANTGSVAPATPGTRGVRSAASRQSSLPTGNVNRDESATSVAFKNNVRGGASRPVSAWNVSLSSRARFGWCRSADACT